MTTAAAVLLAVAGLVALVDWWAVVQGDARTEGVAKPLVLAALIATALVVDPGSDTLRWWFVAALAFSLVGDVALLPRVDNFIVGLGSFLVAHVAYVIGMVQHGDSWLLALVGAVVVAVDLAIVGRRVLAGADAELRLPVLAYFVVLGAMVVAAYATGSFVLVAGSLLFLASDSLLGWDRFVTSPAPGGRLAVITTYHLAQALLVVGLI